MAPKRGKHSKATKEPEKPIIHNEHDGSDDDDRSSDSDFDLGENVVADDSDVSDEEAHDDSSTVDTAGGKRKRTDDGVEGSRKRVKAGEEATTEGFNRSTSKKSRSRARGKVSFADLDSGDEATINSGGSRSKRGHAKGIVIDEDEEGGEGGWVKTRSQRALEVDDDRPLATTDGATIDVDEVWSRLASLPIGRSVEIEKSQVPSQNENDFITIKRTTRFAGEVTTEEKRVHKHSAEAKLYLEEQEKKKQDDKKPSEEPETSEPSDVKPSLRRPLKRLSRFEANPTGEVKTLPPHLQLRWPRSKTAEMSVADAGKFTGPRGLPAAKINTVDKSRQDWAGFVDKAGIAEELDKYGKSKSTYLGRQDFLNRAENHVEQGLRAARQKG